MNLTVPARHTFIGLQVFCDDGGNHPASARTLQAELFPSDGLPAGVVEEWVDELVTEGLVEAYEADGRWYWHVVGWLSYQRIDKPTIKHSPFRRVVDELSPMPTRPLSERSTITRRALAPVLEGRGYGDGDGKENGGEGIQGTGNELNVRGVG